MSSVVVIGEWTIDYYGIPWWNSFPPMCSPSENCIETRCVARWVTRGGACTVWVSRGGAYIVWVTRGGAFTVWVTRGGAYTVWVTRGGAYTVWVTRGGLYTKKIVYMLSLYDKRWSRKILIDKKLKKIKVEWQGLNLRLLLKIGWSIYNSITMMGKIWTFFLCCRYWSAGWMAGQNLSYCGTYYDMFFESLSICLLGSFAWFSKNFYIYIYVFSTDLLLIF